MDVGAVSSVMTPTTTCTTDTMIMGGKITIAYAVFGMIKEIDAISVSPIVGNKILIWSLLHV